MATLITKIANAGVSGTAGDDVIVISDATAALEGAQSIAGGAGNDEIRFNGVPHAVLDGFDRISGIESVVISPTGSLSPAVTTGTVAIDVDASAYDLTGEAGLGIAFVGNAGANRIIGTIWSDTLTGGPGADSLFGGAGDDSFLLSSPADYAGDVIDGEDGFDTLAVTFAVSGSLNLGADTDVERVVLTGAGATKNLDLSALATGLGVEVVGSGTADVVTGSAFADTMTGGLGADNLSGGGGDDVFLAASIAELAGDTITGGAGVDTLRYTGTAATSVVLAAGGINVDAIAIADARGDGTGTAKINLDASSFGTIALYGNDGDNSLASGAGNDTIDGADGNDTLASGAGSDSVDGGGGNDTIAMAAALTSADTISGGAGSDLLTYKDAGGTNELDHVTGIEAIRFDNASAAVVTVDGLVAAGQMLVVNGSALVGANSLVWNGAAESDGNFSVTGGGGNDTLTGGAGNDSLSGGAGADSVVAGAGADRLDGGTENDSFAMAGNLSAADTVTGGAGNDALSVSGNAAATDLDNVTGVEAITLAAGRGYGYVISDGSAFDADTTTVSIIGGALGATESLAVDGGALSRGIDVAGGAGNDLLTGGAGNDTLSGGGGNDLIVAARGADRLGGGNGDDTFTMAGNLTVADTVVGGSGADVLTYTDAGGTDELNNVSLVETIVLGDAATAVITVNSLVAAGAVLTVGAGALGGSNALNWNGGAESDGRFSITGSGNADTLVGGAGADTLDGGAGNDSLAAGAGADSIVAGTGVDRIDAGADGDFIGMGANLTAADSVSGGSGNDTLAISAASAPSALDNVTGVESVILQAGSDYVFAITDGSAFDADTTRVSIDGRALGAEDTLRFDASALARGISLAGGAGADTFTGGAGKDSFAGGAGDDAIVVGRGSSSMGESIDGGDGTDTLYFIGGTSRDLLTLGPVRNLEFVRIVDAGFSSAGTRALSVDASGAVVAIGNTLTIVGNDGSNTLTGTRFADVLEGGGGGDTLIGGSGDDSLFGGAGGDVMQGGAGNDVFFDIAAGDQVYGGRDADAIALSGAAQVLDLTTMGLGTTTRIVGVERIDITGSGDNELRLSVASVTAISGAVPLRIDGDAGDRVSSEDTWIEGGTSDGYVTFTSGGATVQVQEGVSAFVTFVVSEASGGVSFSGSATGDITVSWSGASGDSVATFTRSGITAANKPDFAGTAARIELALDQTLAGQAAGLAGLTLQGDGNLRVTGDATIAAIEAIDFHALAGTVTYRLADSATHLLAAGLGDPVASAAAVVVAGGDAGILTLAQAALLASITTDDGWSFGIDDSAGNLLAVGGPIAGATTVTITGGVAGTGTVAEVALLRDITTDDTWIFALKDTIAHLGDLANAGVVGGAASVSVEDTAANLLAFGGPIPGALAVTVAGGVAGTGTIAQVLLLREITTDDGWSYGVQDTVAHLSDPANAGVIGGATSISVEDTAANLLALGAPIPGALAVVVAGGEAGALAVADVATLAAITTDDGWHYSLVDTAAHLAASGAVGDGAVNVVAADPASAVEATAIVGLANSGGVAYGIIDTAAAIAAQIAGGTPDFYRDATAIVHGDVQVGAATGTDAVPDLFRFASAGDAAVTRFSDGQDLIDLSGFVSAASVVFEPLSGPGTVSVAVSDSGADRLIAIDLNDDTAADMTITLVGQAGIAVDATDFLFG